MNTWVLCFSRRNAFECTIRSRSRWNGVRRGESSSGATRRAGYERAASGDSVASSRALSRWWKSTLPVVTVTRPIVAAGAAARRPLRALAGRRLGGRHARDRHPVRRAAHVVEPRELEEGDRGGVAAVLAADAELQGGLGLAARPRRKAHQPADPRPINRLERATVHDPLLHVPRQEAALGVVAGEAERSLGQV